MLTNIVKLRVFLTMRTLIVVDRMCNMWYMRTTTLAHIALCLSLYPLLFSTRSTGAPFAAHVPLT